MSASFDRFLQQVRTGRVMSRGSTGRGSAGARARAKHEPSWWGVRGSTGVVVRLHQDQAPPSDLTRSPRASTGMHRLAALTLLFVIFPLVLAPACGSGPHCGPGTQQVGNFCFAEDSSDPNLSTTSGSSGSGASSSSDAPSSSDPWGDSWDPVPGSSSGGGPCTPLQCGVDVSCGVVGDGCGGQIDCGSCEDGGIDGIVPVHVVADRSRARLYVSVRSDSQQHPNELVVVDPASAAIIDSVFVGSDPSTMAISDDASTLWVGLEGSLEIRRVELTTPSPTPGPQYALPPGDWEVAVAGPMVVLPGTVTSVAVSLHNYNYSPSFQGATILDDGVPRANKTPGHTGAARLTGGPPGWLFGFNNLHTGFGFYAINTAPAGPTQTEHEGLIDGFSTDIVFADGRVYASSGDVVDVSNPAAPQKAGVFPFIGAVLPRLDQGRVLMLTPANFDNNTAILRDLDPVTFTQKGQVPLPALTAEVLFDLCAADNATLAVIASNWDTEPKLHVLANPFAG